MTVLDTHHSDFGLIDFLFQRMTFDGQDSLRLLMQQFGQIRTFEVNIFFAISGMVKAIKAFEKDCQATNENFRNLKNLALTVHTEFASLEIHEAFSLTSHINMKKRSSKEIKAWLILQDSNDCDENEDLLRYVGAYVCLLLSSYKMPKHLENTIFRLLRDGKDFLNENPPFSHVRFRFRTRRFVRRMHHLILGAEGQDGASLRLSRQCRTDEGAPRASAVQCGVGEPEV